MAETNGAGVLNPVEIELDLVEATTIRFTPRELRLIRENTGRSYSEIVADETSDDRFTVMAWLKARRDGTPIEWDEMDDVLISIVNSAAPDPTTALQGATSPSSATSTG